MKVVIENPLSIISSAYYEKCTDNTSILVINTNERWRNFDASGSLYDGSYFFEYWSDSLEDVRRDEVKLIAENETEQEVLDRLQFYQQEKEQMIVLFIDNCLIGG